ncbi:hypothetical protein [Ideonella sp. A 288]|uniref:hypothetical protein n=1 Tax=Ideonella sp. A 288 TaxID=1962181 RepID=UPI0013039FE2|nr:hypothetical protein [Ideonella sp. A 288]
MSTHPMTSTHPALPARPCGAPVRWLAACGLALALGPWASPAQALPLAGGPWAATVHDPTHSHPEVAANLWSVAERDSAALDGQGPFRCDLDDAPDCGVDDDPWADLVSPLTWELGGVEALSIHASDLDGLPRPDLPLGDADHSFAELEAAGRGLAVVLPEPVGVPEPGTIVLVLAALGLSLLPGFRQWVD